MLYPNLFAQIVIETIVFIWLLENVAHEAIHHALPRLNTGHIVAVILSELYLLNFERFMIFIEHPLPLPWLWEAIYVIQIYVPIVLILIIARLLSTLKQLTVGRHEYENWKQSALHLTELIIIIPLLFIEFAIANIVFGYI